jgi:hypothetical protein
MLSQKTLDKVRLREGLVALDGALEVYREARIEPLIAQNKELRATVAALALE